MFSFKSTPILTVLATIACISQASSFRATAATHHGRSLAIPTDAATADMYLSATLPAHFGSNVQGAEVSVGDWLAFYITPKD